MTSTRSTKRAIIIGGGIAGTVSAMGLRKAGFEATIYEAYDFSADGVGAFLNLAANGVRALRTIDVDASQIEGGFATPAFAIYLSDGTKLADLANGPKLDDGTVSQTVKRGDLYRSLRIEAERRGIEMCFGKRLVSAEKAGDGVIARFEDGTEARGDFLIGADGLQSRVRAILDPKAPRARYVGLLNTGGFARGVDVPGERGVMHMIFGKRCFFCYVVHPDGDVWWFANPARKREPTREELAAISPDAWRAELVDLFSEDRTPAVEIIRATQTILSGWSTYDFPRVPRWHDGSMIVIGDAAHAASPSSGQGASMAIEDGVVLAKCLRDLPNTREAFAAYERSRRARVERVVKQGRRNGTGKTPGPLGRAVRDFVLRRVFARMKSGADPMRWIFEYPLAWEPRVAA
jgi:FAD-dependent urate hydroxylase